MYEKLSAYINEMSIFELTDLIASAKDRKAIKEFIDIDGIVGYIYEHNDCCENGDIEDILNDEPSFQDGHDYDCSANYMGV